MEDPRGERLYELLVALFRSDEELQRFLVLEGIAPTDTRSVQVQKRGRSEGVYETVEALVAQGRVDEAFFAALERRSPDRAPDIDGVRRLFLDGPASAEAPPSPGPAVPTVPDHLADFAQQLAADLASTPGTDDVATALDEEHWPWTASAAVLGSFNPTALTPLSTAEPPTMRPMAALVDLVTVSHSGGWVLRNDVRRACLSRLAEERRLDEALAGNRRVVDQRRDLLAELVHGQHQQLTLMDRTRLVDLDAVLEWLEPLDLPLPVSRATVHAAADRRALIDPLRSLVGTHFRGRVVELGTVRTQISAEGTPDPLFVVGAGGAGKSTLVGKVLLELEERAVFDPVSFAYLDFDKARNDPRDRNGLLQQLSQQLRLLYANADVAEQFAAAEASYGGTDLVRAAELLDLPDGLDGDAILDTLCRNLDQLHRQQADQVAAPLVLVLDTCEEVLAKGPGAVQDLVGLLRDLQARLPGVRIVISGRAALPWPTAQDDAATLRLGDLDPVAADAVLQHLGVRDPELRTLILTKFGGNPLTLRLAAEALSRAGTAQAAFSGVATTPAVAEVAIEQVQGMLYTRILGHIRDPEVSSVAHPGLAVRRVTVPVLRDVLAIPCGFAPERAGQVFDKLRAELSLFDLEGDDTLLHRQDVRRLMLRTMVDDAERAAKVADIHRRAAQFYAHESGPAARTEALYHRMMSDEDPRRLEHLWDETVRQGLESALEEPLPPRARRWLERRLSTVPVEEDRSEWEQEDWEAEAYSRASSWLASSAPQEVLTVLGERETRLPGSRLFALEVAARLALDDVPGAAAALDRAHAHGIENAERRVQLELAEQTIAVRARQDDGPGLAVAATTCVGLAELVGEPSRGLRALTSALSDLRRMGADTEANAVQEQLSSRFERMSRHQMRTDPDLVRQVLHTAGPSDNAVLLHAAVQVGDQTNAVAGIFLEDPFALSRLLGATTASAGPALQQLATEVGLVSGRWTIDELASRLVRTGRTGKAVAVSLDYAADDDQMRADVVAQLVHPPETVKGKS